MKNINLNFDLLQLDGSKFENAGKVIAGVLVSDTKDNDAIKLYGWALQLYEGKSISLDNSDFNKLRTFVNNHPNIFVLVKAQVINYLDSIKESK